MCQASSDFISHVFRLIKGATGGQISGLDRLFVTGVSLVAMDDVTSGFNIGTNISLDLCVEVEDA